MRKFMRSGAVMMALICMLSLSGCPQTKKEADSNKTSGDNSVNDETEVDTTDENAESDSQPVEDEVYIIKSIARHYNSSGEPSSRFEYEYDALGNETKKIRYYNDNVYDLDTPYDSFEYEYDIEGNILKEKHLNSKGVIYEYTEW